jgi:hypothetical protein
VISFLKTPRIESPRLLTLSTLPAATCCLKKVYGMMIEDGSGKHARISR